MKEPTQQRLIIQEINHKQLGKQDITQPAVLKTCTTHSLNTRFKFIPYHKSSATSSQTHKKQNVEDFNQPLKDTHTKYEH